MISDATENVVGRGVNPPAVFATGMGTVVISRLLKLPGRFPGAVRVAGFTCLVLGLALGASAGITQRRAGTPVDPHLPSQTVVQSGPYRFSRNPIYLGMGLVVAGAALVFSSILSLLILPVMMVVLDRGMVRREETYLEGRFGDAYRQYRGRVRRWL
jgi:protein-S-isoprenylcysteine O-methyltransferase Ste14